MDTLFAQLNFLTADSGLLFTAGLVALAVVLWEWRLALLSLLVAQITVAALVVGEYSVASQWGLVQIVVILLCCLILAISAIQRPGGHRMYLAGNTFLRATALALILLAAYLFEFSATLPLLDTRTTQFLAWLAISALLMLALGDSALFTAVALLQWSIVAQAVTEVLLRLPGLVSVIGVLELMIALACSYLVLTESITRARPAIVSTDIDPRSRIQLAGQVQRAEAARRTGEFQALLSNGYPSESQTASEARSETDSGLSSVPLPGSRSIEPPANGKAASGETASGKTPGRETPGTETPGRETPGRETPGRETTGEETTSDHAAVSEQPTQLL